MYHKNQDIMICIIKLNMKMKSMSLYSIMKMKLIRTHYILQLNLALEFF